ncbi:GNAT family N-acetyltransferase [Paenibacillus sp. MBLB4367]|uniref:GNAT family N-acetyltransferase n=1 Tax=Paenibacillus sp. MBLB4367 TaxID=3384767 RepID=UPI00390843A2
MMNHVHDKLVIRKMEENDMVPYDLLTLADPNLYLVKSYMKRGVTYLAQLEEETVGVYVLIDTRPETMELVNIAVDEKFHGMGIGKKLVLHAIESAKSTGVKTLEIGTGNSSLSQLGLYQKCGFRLTGIDKDFFVRHYDEEIYENGIQCVDMVRLGIDF